MGFLGWHFLIDFFKSSFEQFLEAYGLLIRPLEFTNFIDKFISILPWFCIFQFVFSILWEQAVLEDKWYELSDFGIRFIIEQFCDYSQQTLGHLIRLWVHASFSTFMAFIQSYHLFGENLPVDI